MQWCISKCVGHQQVAGQSTLNRTFFAIMTGKDLMTGLEKGQYSSKRKQLAVEPLEYGQTKRFSFLRW